MSVDHSGMRLGKLRARHDPRTLRFADYVDTNVLPAPPPSCDWTRAVSAGWGMMLNDKIGDCTCAAAGHLVQDWTANSRHAEVTIADGDIEQAYEAVSGFNPATGQNDDGAVETDVLNYWRRTGIGGHNIAAYVALEPGNHAHVRDAINLFGGCYIGLDLPIAAQAQLTWTVPPGGTTGTGAPGSWGGHAVALVAYNTRRVTCVSWGDLKQMTWGFLGAYCDEAYAVLSTEFLEADRSPQGFDLAQLQADLAQLSDHPVPAAAT